MRIKKRFLVAVALFLTVLSVVCSVSVMGAETSVFGEGDLLKMASSADAAPLENTAETSLGLCIVYGLLTLLAILFAVFYPRRRSMKKQRKK